MSAGRRAALWGPAAALVLAALCLRGPFAAVGPVLDELRVELPASTAALAVLTALPLVSFGLVSPLAPALAARTGAHRAVVAGTVGLAVGILLRPAGVVGMFAGTALLTAGIAVVNVLLPAVARAEYGPRSATVLGLTTAAMGASASIGAGLAQPLAASGGSAQAGLVLWVLPTVGATAALVVLAARRPAVAAPGGVRSPGALLGNRTALAVTVFFGFQALSFYSMLTWLAEVLEARAGVTPVAAGGLVALAAALGVPASVLLPPLFARRPGQAPWVVGICSVTAAGIVGLLVAPAAAPALWAVLYGLGTGAAFPLALTLVLLRTRDVAQTGRLSAVAQSVGYLMAATGPLAVGLLHGATGSWQPGLVLLLGVLVAQVLVGVVAARPRLVQEAALPAA